MVTFEPMREDQYERFVSVLWEAYTHERARNARTPLDEERALVAKQHASLLPDGMRTPGHLFWNIVDEAVGPVGVLWVFVDEQTHRAYIYDIEIDAAHRRHGYGEQALSALEERMRSQGVMRIALNVFGDNDVAMRLYQRVGYRTLATMMQKELAE